MAGSSAEAEEAEGAGAPAPSPSSPSCSSAAPAAAPGAGDSAKASSLAVAPSAASEGSAVASAPGATAGVDVLTGPHGEVVGFSVGAGAQAHGVVDRVLALPRLLALPVAERYALAGKVAAVSEEHARIAERLISAIGTSLREVSALNALYLLEICRELVPGFRELVDDERLQKAAELSPHARVRAAIVDGEKPAEWDRALEKQAPAVVLLPDAEDEEGPLADAGRRVSDATKLVGGAAFGGVGLVTDTLGLTTDAEESLADAAEDVVDVIGSGVGAVASTLDDGLHCTVQDVKEKGVVVAVGDGVADAVDMVSGFLGGAVDGIAGGVHDLLDWATAPGGNRKGANPMFATHRLAVVVQELFGPERSLGLLIEERVVTRFTKPEAETLGFKLGDSVYGVGFDLVWSQEELLAAIGSAKERLKSSGTPIRFLVERMGPAPPGTAAAEAAAQTSAG